MSELPASSPEEALRWAIQAQRGIAFNLGYLDFPSFDEEIGDLSWQLLSQLHEVEYTLLNDWIVARVEAGDMWKATKWETKDDE